jgi:hypothetical protein
MSVHITATVITATAGRVRIGLICPTRSAADVLIERLYPDALFTSLIVRRRTPKEAKPC